MVREWLENHTPEKIVAARTRPVAQGKGIPEALQIVGTVDKAHGRVHARSEIAKLEVSDEVRALRYDKYPAAVESAPASDTGMHGFTKAAELI